MAMAKSLIIIDSRVRGYENFIAQLDDKYSFLALDALLDGVEQITGYLKSLSDIPSIHLITHGSQASLQLGSTYLNLSNLASFTDQLSQMRNAVTSGGDLLIYGCDVAQGQLGESFIKELSKSQA